MKPVGVTDYTNKTSLGNLDEKIFCLTTVKNGKKNCQMCTKLEVHIFNV